MKKSNSAIENAKDRQKLAWDSITYSDRRIDYLLIFISGAGIYVCLETIRYNSTKCFPVHWLIWLSSISFLTTILLNFIGQFIGKKSNQYDYLMSQSEIDSYENPNDDKLLIDIKKYDDLSDKYDKWVNYINYTCTALMIFGISFILGYFLLVF